MKPLHPFFKKKKNFFGFLGLVFFSSVCIHLIYEVLKEALFGHFSKWQSHWITVSFSAVFVTIVVYLFFLYVRKIVSYNEMIQEKQRVLEEIAREQAHLFEMVLEAIPDPVFFKDSKGVYRMCNQSFCNFLDIQENKILGATVFDLVPKELADQHHKKDMELLNKNDGSFQKYESQVGTKNECIRDVLFHKALVSNAKGECIGLVGVIRDITEQNRLRTELEKKSNQLQQLVDEKTAEISNTNALLKLFTQYRNRGQYLEAVIGILKEWTGFECGGIRTLESCHYIPYQVSYGLADSFLESECFISKRNDDCVCTRIASGAVLDWEKDYFTYGGSFFCPDTEVFLESMNEDRRKRYRGVCLTYGFKTLLLVPLKYHGKIIGLIHLADSNPKKIKKENIYYLEFLADLIAEALEHYEVEQNLQNNLGFQKLLNEFLESSFEILESSLMFTKFQESLLNSDGFPIKKCWIGLKESDSTFKLKAFTPRDNSFDCQALPPFSENSLTMFQDNNKVLYPVEEETSDSISKHYFYYIPLRNQEKQIFGVMGIQMKNFYKPEQFVEKSFEIMGRTLNNICLRKDAEKKVDASLKMFELVLNTIPARVFWKDKNLNYLGCNLLFAQDSGHASPSDVIGKSDFSMVWKEQAELYSLDDMAVIKTGRQKINYEEVQTTPELSLRWVKTSKVPLRQVDGKLIGVLGTYEDITGKKVAEEKLKESEDRFRQMADHINEVFFLMDYPSLNMVYFSNAAKTLFDINKEEMNEHSRFWKEYIHPEDRKIVFKGFINIHKAGINEEIRAVLKDKSIRWVRVRAFPIWNESSSKVIRIAGIISDITQYKESHERERKQQLQLIQADKLASLGILVAGVAHEINNPNNFILPNSRILLKVWKEVSPILDEYKEEKGDFFVSGMPYSEAKDELVKIIEGITIGAERIKNIVENLKKYSRETHDGIQEVFLMDQVVQSVHLLLSHIIKKSTDHFRLQVENDLPPIIGNPQQIEQVLMNLITNACQALPDKSRSIDLRVYYEKSKEAVLVEVEDQGVGIAEKDIKQIFNPFFTTKRGKGGTGLGLSITEKIVKDHGGTIVFDSELFKGTKVSVSFPVYKKTE